jgi:hypothetical protein
VGGLVRGDGLMRVVSVSVSLWIVPFTGLRVAQFRRLVRVVAARGGSAVADGRACRPWSLGLADRVPLVART